VEIPGARRAVESGADELRGYINGREYAFNIGPLTKEEREILLAGCLMNWYAEKRK
jgi:aconitate hydratase